MSLGRVSLDSNATSSRTHHVDIRQAGLGGLISVGYLTAASIRCRNMFFGKEIYKCFSTGVFLFSTFVGWGGCATQIGIDSMYLEMTFKVMITNTLME